MASYFDPTTGKTYTPEQYEHLKSNPFFSRQAFDRIQYVDEQSAGRKAKGEVQLADGSIIDANIQYGEAAPSVEQMQRKHFHNQRKSFTKLLLGPTIRPLAMV